MFDVDYSNLIYNKAEKFSAIIKKCGKLFQIAEKTKNLAS